MPDGLLDLNEANLVTWHFDYSIEPLRDGGLPAMILKQRESETLMAEFKAHPFMHLDEALATMLTPPMSGATLKIVYAQSLINRAIAACALERYRIEHNAYPDTIEAANRPGEKAIPLDILSGKPMGYRKTANGKYALWCVGFTGIDHGGKRILDEQNPERTRFADLKYQGDWVWDYPER